MSVEIVMMAASDAKKIVERAEELKPRAEHKPDKVVIDIIIEKMSIYEALLIVAASVSDPNTDTEYALEAAGVPEEIRNKVMMVRAENFNEEEYEKHYAFLNEIVEFMDELEKHFDETGSKDKHDMPEEWAGFWNS